VCEEIKSYRLNPVLKPQRRRRRRRGRRKESLAAVSCNKSLFGHKKNHESKESFLELSTREKNQKIRKNSKIEIESGRTS
jgi:hypothetical protein